MSNYPPGVTGNEYQLAGPDDQWMDDRTCAWPVSGVATTAYTTKLIDSVREAEIAFSNDKNGSVQLASDLSDAASVLLRHLQSSPRINMDTCPFVGEVDLERFDGITSWTCPECGAEHCEDDDGDEA